MFEGGSIEVGGEVASQDWRRLHEKLRGIAMQRTVLEAREIACLVEAEEAQLHRRMGYATFLEYMERELGWGPHAGSERLRVAHDLLDLPLLHDEFAAGKRCYSVVRELTRVATAQTEEAWLDKTERMTARQVELAVKGRRKGDLPSARPDPSIVKEKAMFELGPEAVALMRQVRALLDAERGSRLSDQELMIEMCKAILAPGGEGLGKPATQVGVVTCRACKKGWQVGAGVACELPPATLEKALCDATEIGDLDTDVRSRPKSKIPEALRRKVFLRDKKGCVVPGCRSGRHLEVHHIHHQAKGGKHRMWNMALMCSMHHAQHHDGLIVIDGRAPDLVFRWTHDVVSSVRPTWDAAVGPAWDDEVMAGASTG